ncbi:MAG: O-antigen ligase family protein [Candidatus Zixiibacteriota bacterium]|nr:MAG: O-antigen ligase family protein [candidate division Zixibacteria bacterium]
MKAILNRFFGFSLENSLSDNNRPSGIGEKIIITGSIIFALGMPWSHVFGYIGAGIAFMGAVVSPGFLRFGRNEKTIIILLLSFFAWGIILSLTVAIRPSNGLNTVFAYFAHWLIPLMIGLWMPSRCRTFILYLWMFSLIILGFVSFLAFAGFFDAPRFSREGMLMGLHNHIQLAALLLLGFNIIYGLFLTPGLSKRRYLLVGIVGALFLVLFILTGSRGWWVAGFISICGMTIHHILSNRSRKTALILTAVGILFALSIVALSPQVRARINRTGFNDPNIIHRRNMAVMAREVIKENPVFGIGPGQTPYAKEYYDRMEKMDLPQETGYLHKKHFHNIYFQITAEFGLPGMVLFMFILIMGFVVLISAGLKSPGNHNSGIIYGVIWSFVALAVAELFDCLLRGPAVAMEYFWIMGVCARLGQGMIKAEQ